MNRLPVCLFLDLDGTILDSLPGVEYSVRMAFESCGLPTPQEQLRSMIGPPIRMILARAGRITDPFILDALEHAFRASYDSEGWQKTVCFPDAKTVLRILRSRGHRMFVVSNKPRHIALRILESEGIGDVFEEIVTADSRIPVYGGKSEMICSLIAKSGAQKRDCLMIGDTMEDAKAARESGIGFAYMTHGYGQLADTDLVPTDIKLDSFLQFLPLAQGGRS